MFVMGADGVTRHVLVMNGNVLVQTRGMLLMVGRVIAWGRVVVIVVGHGVGGRVVVGGMIVVGRSVVEGMSGVMGSVIVMSRDRHGAIVMHGIQGRVQMRRRSAVQMGGRGRRVVTQIVMEFAGMVVRMVVADATHVHFRVGGGLVPQRIVQRLLRPRVIVVVQSRFVVQVFVQRSLVRQVIG